MFQELASQAAERGIRNSHLSRLQMGLAIQPAANRLERNDLGKFLTFASRQSRRDLYSTLLFSLVLHRQVEEASLKSEQVPQSTLKISTIGGFFSNCSQHLTLLLCRLCITLCLGFDIPIPEKPGFIYHVATFRVAF